MAKKKPKKPLVTRPAAWWREPLTPAHLRNLKDVGASRDEIAVIRAQERALKTEKLKDQIRELRKYSRDFDAKDGYPLKAQDVIRLHPSKIKKLKDAHEQIVRAKGQGYIEVKPRSDRQAISTIQRAGQIIPGQKVFFLHGVDPTKSQVDFVDGNLRVTSAVTGGAVYDVVYYFPHKPRSWRDIKDMTAAIQRKGMKHGNYKILNSLYGPIGETVSHDQLQEQLEEYFGTYNRWMAGTMLGWRWYGSTQTAAGRKIKRERTTAERFKETRKFIAQKRERQIKERLGVAKRCKRCRRKKCVCKAPEY